MMMVALVTLNYNESEKCVNLVNNHINSKCFDYIVVVDNNSNEYQKKYLKSNLDKRAILLEKKENDGFAKGNNYGLKYVSENLKDVEYVFISNPDIIFEEEAIFTMLEDLNSIPELGAISCLRKEKDGQVIDSFWNFTKIGDYYKRFFLILNKFRKKKNSVKHNESVLFYTDCVRGSFIGFRLDLLKKVDYFDEGTFLYYEEDILFSKFKRNAIKVAVDSRYYYIHDHEYKKKIKTNIAILKETYKSLYYYLVKYRNINAFRKIQFKISSGITVLEFRLLNCFRIKSK